MPKTTVYIWLPAPLPAYKQVGHASLELSDGTYISWWPGNKDNSDNPDLFGGQPGAKHLSLGEDIARERRSQDRTIELLDMLNENAIREWWEEIEGNYNVVTKNCCNIVHDALHLGGGYKYLPMSYFRYNNVKGQISSPILTPGKIEELASLMQSYHDNDEWSCNVQ